MKQYFFCLLLTLITWRTTAQKVNIITLDGSTVEINIVSDSTKQKLLQEFSGEQDKTLYKQWTSRTFRLSNDRVLIEFFDRQAAVLESKKDFEKLKEIRFTKNHIDFLKKNVTYKIELSFATGLELSKTARPIRDLKSEMPEYYDFAVYEMKTGQILFLNNSTKLKSATIYENIKSLCSDNADILQQYYKGMDEWSEKLVNGDPMFDYETDGYLVYPKDIAALIKNHNLSVIGLRVYVHEFYGNLYKSNKGYYVLIDEVNQNNGSGDKLPILNVRIYDKLQALRSAQAKYKQVKKEGVISEHFYQKISDQYGKNFPANTNKLIETLPLVLNFDKEQLTFDSTGMAIVDEAIRWNHSNHELFDEWYPSVLAYYGHCYMTEKKDGRWIVEKEKGYNVWTPHLVLSNDEEAFDIYDFYKDMSEWPHPIKEAGDWDGWRKTMRKRLKLDSGH